MQRARAKITLEMYENIPCCKSFTDIARPGDYVADKIIDDLISAIPPATLTHNLFQSGEPANHINGRPVYLTFFKNGGNWQYAGLCYRDEIVRYDRESA